MDTEAVKGTVKVGKVNSKLKRFLARAGRVGVMEAKEDQKLVLQEYQVVLDAHGIDRIGQALECLEKRKRQLEAENNDE